MAPENWKGKKGKHLKRVLAEAHDAAIILVNPTDADKFLRVSTRKKAQPPPPSGVLAKRAPGSLFYGRTRSRFFSAFPPVASILIFCLSKKKKTRCVVLSRTAYGCLAGVVLSHDRWPSRNETLMSHPPLPDPPAPCHTPPLPRVASVFTASGLQHIRARISPPSHASQLPSAFAAAALPSAPPRG